MKLILFLAKRYLFSSPKSFRSWMILVATAGIFFATCMVLVSLGVLAGYQKVYKEAVLGFSTHIIVYKEEGLSQGDRIRLKTFLKKSATKNHFSPYHFFEAIAPGDKGPKPIIFKGIATRKIKDVYNVELEDFETIENGVYVGVDVLTHQRSIKEKGLIQYLSSGRSLSETQAQYMGTIPVQGTFKSGYYDFDSRFILMPLTLLHKLFLDEPVVSGYEVRLVDVGDIQKLKEALLYHFGADFEVLTWDELNASLLQALKIDRTVVFTVSFLILMIACMNVFGFNFLFFIQRKREFLILSALGLGLKKLRRLMAVISFALGGFAALVGSICALLVLSWLAKDPGVPMDPQVYYVNKVPVYFEVTWFVIFFLATIVLCYLTSVIAGRVILRRTMTANLG